MAGNPTWGELLNELVDSKLMDVHTAIPAIVERFNDAEDTVDAKPAIKARVPAVDGSVKAETIPIINDIPVGWPGSKTCYVKWEITKGSTVLLIFSEACIAQWRETGQVSEPGDLARHDLSYPYALPIRGPTVLDRPGAVGAAWVAEATELKLGAGATELVALSNLVNDNFTALKTWLDAHVHPTGMGPSGPPPTPLPDPGDVACSKVKAE